MVVERGRNLHPRLAARPDLELVYADAGALVFARRTAGKSRVAPGSRPLGAPTDPDVRDSRIRLFSSRVRSTSRTHP